MLIYKKKRKEKRSKCPFFATNQSEGSEIIVNCETIHLACTLVSLAKCISVYNPMREVIWKFLCSIYQRFDCNFLHAIEIDAKVGYDIGTQTLTIGLPALERGVIEPSVELLLLGMSKMKKLMNQPYHVQFILSVSFMLTFHKILPRMNLQMMRGDQDWENLKNLIHANHDR